MARWARAEDGGHSVCSVQSFPKCCSTLPRHPQMVTGSRGKVGFTLSVPMIERTQDEASSGGGKYHPLPLDCANMDCLAELNMHPVYLGRILALIWSFRPCLTQGFFKYRDAVPTQFHLCSRGKRVTSNRDEMPSFLHSFFGFARNVYQRGSSYIFTNKA